MKKFARDSGEDTMGGRNERYKIHGKAWHTIQQNGEAEKKQVT